ncbi:MAG: alpha/beta fold hydrolase [Gemmatimonadota bacterium]|nr:alpha/beta fold hydrolase [Gemmatimonadota bacterium]
MSLLRRAVTRLAVFVSLAPCTMHAQAAAGLGRQGDWVARNFVFTTGETLPELRLHYTTLGAPRRDAAGVVQNAVMILHGTGGTGRAFLSATYAGELFGPGQLLDTTRYYIILPDGIGHGGSSKPSDGLRARFPRYTYDDMVRAQHLLLTKGLGVNHLRIVMGTSMGCMHAWVWGYTYPAFADGLVPLACAPAPIVGRNRMMRRMILDDIRDDPGYRGGDYTEQPKGVLAASQLLFMMTSAPLVQHRQAPTREAADSVITAYLANRVRVTDANDMLYQFDASRDYDPSPHLARISAPVLAINSADDLVNPPELGTMERLMPQVAKGRYILLPITPQTRGHGTHSVPAIWGGHLGEFLKALPER